MYLKVGNLSLPANSVTPVISRVNKFNEQQVATEMTESWSLAGEIRVPSGTSDANAFAYITAQIEALTAAFTSGVDYVFYNESNVASAHRLISANAIRGTRVTTAIEFPVGNGGEYSRWREWRAVVEADFVPGNQQNQNNNFLSSQETFEIIGDGGPEIMCDEYLNGPPQMQQVREQTKVTFIQSGEAQGYGSYPFRSPPLYPDYIQRPRSSVRFMPPATLLGVAQHPSRQIYKVSWNYYCELPFGINF